MSEKKQKKTLAKNSREEKVWGKRSTGKEKKTRTLLHVPSKGVWERIRKKKGGGQGEKGGDGKDDLWRWSIKHNHKEVDCREWGHEKVSPKNSWTEMVDLSD